MTCGHLLFSWLVVVGWFWILRILRLLLGFCWCGTWWFGGVQCLFGGGLFAFGLLSVYGCFLWLLFGY